MDMIILVLEIFCHWRFLRSFLGVYIVTVFFKVKASARRLQLISVKVSSMSWVLSVPSWLLLEPNHCCIPLEVSRVPNLPRQVFTTSNSSILNLLFVVIAIRVPSHSHGSTQGQDNFLLLRYWLLSPSLSPLYSLAALFLSLCDIFKVLKR